MACASALTLVQVVEVLLSHGAAVDLADSKGMTALAHAEQVSRNGSSNSGSVLEFVASQARIRRSKVGG